MPFSSKNLTFGIVKTETTAGTPIWNLTSTYPADADFKNRLYDIEVSPEVEFDEDVANIATGDHGELSGLTGKQSATITFSFPLTYGGAVATVPNWSDILAACGLYKSAYTTTGIGWQPLKRNDNATVSIAVFNMDVGGATPNSTGYLFAGCAGNAVISAENNGKFNVQCTFKGKFVGVYAVANANIPETTGFQTELAEKLLNASCTINSVAQYISSFSLDCGNDIQPIIDQSEATGYESFYIASRKPRFSCNPLQLVVGDDGVYARLMADSNYPMTMVTASSQITIYAPRAQLMPYTIAEREGLVNHEQNYMLQRNSNGAAAILATIPDEATFEILQGARA